VSDDRVEIGRVVKAHGLRGEVAVHLLSDVPDRLAPSTAVWVGGRATTVATMREHQGRPLVRFEHVHDRNGAELLRGLRVEAVPVDPEELDTYLISELIGRRVVDADDVELGTVSQVIEMPAVAGYDLLEVTRGDGTTFLLPAADELVEAEEREDGLVLVVVDAPEGLLDGPVARAAEQDT
jgi:16S rRNA processing protein RimM